MRKFWFRLLPLAVVGLCGQAPAFAQFLGYVSPQTVYQVLAPAGTVCGGTILTFNIQNLGQTQHWVFITFSGGAPQGQNWAQLYGGDGAGNLSAISDLAQGGAGAITGSAILTAQGNFPKMQLQVLCTSGSVTFQATYMGASAATYQSQGNQLVAATDKVIFSAQPANTGNNGPSGVSTTPYGNSAGVLVMQYRGAAGPAGSTIALQCAGSSITFQKNSGVGTVMTYSFIPVATQNVTQTFYVPPGPCAYYVVAYTSGGASAATFDLEYVFHGYGQSPLVYQYSHITGTTATTVKATSGFVHTLSINLGAAGTVSLFDLPAASCTGTPATNQVAVVTATATTLQTFIYDANFLQGICAKASVAMDLTVTFN